MRYHVGGAVNSGLFFCGPSVVAIGGCERKYERKPMGGNTNDGVNLAGGTSEPAVAVEMACRQNTTQDFAQRRIKLRFSKALAISKHGF
jgi:hypothetical protein